MYQPDSRDVVVNGPTRKPVAKLRFQRPILVYSLLALIALEGTAIAQKVREQMTDRCSGDVIIVPKWNAALNTPGSIYLKRDSKGYTSWSGLMPVDNRQIRWYCKSNSPFAFLDPGTWRIKEAGVNVSLQQETNGQVNAKPSVSLKLTTSAQDGWYPERSRCAAGTKYIRAYLGPNRLLRINCY